MSKTDKPNWKKLQQHFLAAHTATGIGAKEWCEAKGLNYQTARRYIKVSKPEKKPRGDGQPFEPGNEHRFEKGNTVGKDTRFKAGNKQGVPNFHPGHAHGAKTAKHGAYAKYFPIEVLQDVAASLGLPDELILVRARIHSLLRSLERIQDDIAQAQDTEVRADLYKAMLTAENHLTRYISQAESIQKTLLVNDYTVAATEHKRTDMGRIKEAAAKLKAEREKLEKDTGGSQTPLSDAVRDIQKANSGLLNV